MNNSNLIWIDLEMTGLEPKKERIIEIATIVTDKELNIIAEGPVFAISQPDNVLRHMDEWNTKQHHSSGLIDRVRQSQITAQEAEQQTLAFLTEYVPAGVSPMCGNTVSQDRRFLVRYMPALEAYFHYRHLDVSTLKILAQQWAPDVYSHYKKESSHLALQDIRDSIDELKYYREQLFKKEYQHV